MNNQDDCDYQRRRSSSLSPTYVTRSGRVTTVKLKKPTKESKMTVQLTNEQFEILIGKIAKPQARSGSFTTCHYTFNGSRKTEEVEAFLSAVNIFKRAENMTDVTALDELPLLLKAEAGVWWHGVKGEVKTWNDFENRLRYNFAPRKEAHLIYAEIHQVKQQTHEATEDFVRTKRMWFSQLPAPVHPETQQLDIIYCLLKLDIRDKISRASIHSFEELITASRSVEVVLKEKILPKKTMDIAASLPRTATPNSKKKCRYCKNFGHSIEECIKKRRVEDLNSKSEKAEIETQAPSPSTPKFSCYGCGAPGVVRSNCPSCHKTKTKPQPSTSSEVGVCAIDITDVRDRPVVFIEVDGIHEAAYIDTYARSSIVSYSMFCQLRREGYHFEKHCIRMTTDASDFSTGAVLVQGEGENAPSRICNKTIFDTLHFVPFSSIRLLRNLVEDPAKPN